MAEGLLKAKAILCRLVRCAKARGSWSEQAAGVVKW